jgi:hypothetical protein
MDDLKRGVVSRWNYYLCGRMKILTDANELGTCNFEKQTRKMTYQRIETLLSSQGRLYQ